MPRQGKPLIDESLFDRARLTRLAEELITALEDEGSFEFTPGDRPSGLAYARLQRITKQVEYEEELKESLKRRKRKRDAEKQ